MIYAVIVSGLLSGCIEPQVCDQRVQDAVARTLQADAETMRITTDWNNERWLDDYCRQQIKDAIEISTLKGLRTVRIQDVCGKFMHSKPIPGSASHVY